MSHWKRFQTVTRDYILNNFEMLLICWPRFPILAVGQGYSIIDDPVKFESHFKKELLTNHVKTSESVCLNPFAKEYFSGKSVFLKKGVKLEVNVSTDKYPCVVTAWMDTDQYTLELLRCD